MQTDIPSCRAASRAESMNPAAAAAQVFKCPGGFYVPQLSQEGSAAKFQFTDLKVSMNMVMLG
jgi:hypothetical protein